MKTVSLITVGLAALALAACNAAPISQTRRASAQEAATERNPLDLRRTTLLVRAILKLRWRSTATRWDGGQL